MALRRLFLNWDKPLLTSSAFELLKLAEGDVFFDLSSILVVVPTSHAIKNLSYRLTEAASAKGCAVLLPKITTPQSFFTCQECGDIPSEAQRVLFWTEAIKINKNNLEVLFPDKLGEDKDFNWYLVRAEKIVELTDTLASIGLTIGQLALNNSGILQEDLERFVELSKIESTYFQLLNKAGFEDSNKIKIKNALNPKLPGSIKKVIFIAVPDPVPIVTESLNALSSSTDIEIWIYAPSNFDSAFDVFGRPVLDFWRNKNIDIPNFKNHVSLFDSPGDLASDFVNLIAKKNDSDNEGINIDDISIIMPDTSLEVAVRHSFFKHGIETYNPSGVDLNKTQPYILFNAILEFILVQDYRSFSNLIRNADFLAYANSIIGELDYSKIFLITDCLQNNYMPISFIDVLNAIEKESNKSGKCKDKASLALYSQVVEIIKEIKQLKAESSMFDVGSFKTSFTELALSKIVEIYDKLQSDITLELKENLLDSVSEIKNIVYEVKDIFYGNNKYEEKDIAHLTIKRLQNTVLTSPHDDGTLPLRGWLEFLWGGKRPYTFVLGMNEGIVPSVTTSDIFLPDSLKKKLGLPNNDSRFARDSYILYSVVKSQTEFPVNFVVMKTNHKGECLKPSRLLLKTSDQDCFYERLVHLFRGRSIVFERQNNAVTKIDAPSLSLSVPFKKLKENTLSVTDFKNYLECPFRFYLRKVLGYEEEIDDTKTDLDNREFGSICHEVLKILGVGLREKVSGKELRSLLARQLAHERAKFSPSVPVEFSFYGLEQRLNKALDVMLEESESEEWGIKDLEKDFNIVFDSSKLGKWLGTPVSEEISFCVKGRVDRIDISKDGKFLRVIDYKTGNVSANPRKDHYRLVSARTNKSPVREYAKFEINGKEYVWTDLQLPLYITILQELSEYSGLEVKSCAYFVIPKAITNTGIISWSEVTEQELFAARKCVARIILNVANGVFWPPSEKVKYDNYEKILQSNVNSGNSLIKSG